MELLVEEEQRPAPPPGGWGYLDVLYLFLFVIPANVLALVLCVAVFLLLDILPTGRFLTYPPLIVAIQVLMSLLLLGFVYMLISFKYRLPFGPAIGWRKPDRSPLLYLLGGVALAAAVIACGHLLPTPTGEMPFDALLRDHDSLILMALCATLLAPATEELLIRGFIFAAIERPHCTPAAVGVTSGLFGMMHGWQYGWHWQSVLLLSCVGVVFGALRARTLSVVPSTLMHTAYNATLSSILFAAGDQIFSN